MGEGIRARAGGADIVKDTSELTVREIYGRAWRLGRVEPLEGEIPLDRFLKVVQEEGMELRVDVHPHGDSKLNERQSVVAADIQDGTMYFLVPEAAMHLLAPRLQG